jgi:PEP-CTERM motif-containing protein
MRIASLSLIAVCLTLAAVPAVAQTVYSNGPIDGNVNSWTINLGFSVSDTFNVSANGTTITGGSFGIWLYPGDTLTSAELSITSGENGGTSFFDQTVNFTTGACAMDQFGYNVCMENTSFSGPTLNIGTYWVNLQNASTPNGDPVYWDENSGPSLASNNSEGTIPSESFTILGTSSSTTSTSTTTTTTVPEPSSIMLFGAGVLGLARAVRRRLF